VDLNNDGYSDLVSGSYSRTGQEPMAGLFQVLSGTPDGKFKKAETLNGTDDKPLIIPAGEGDDGIIESICTRPTAVDWDGDGHLDLVVGNFIGKFYLFKGEGSGKFAPKPQLMKIGDVERTFATEPPPPLKVDGHHGDPFVVDWDGDSDLDLLSGSDKGGVQWAENTAGAKKPPALKAFKPLIQAAEDLQHECRPEDVKFPAGSTRVWAADVNGDGKLDILVGDNISLVSPAKGVSEADFVKRYSEWKKEYGDLTKQTEGVEDQEKLEPIYERMNELRAKRKEFMIEDRTGFVWLYLQK
jgi:hypothetical protein